MNQPKNLPRHFHGGIGSCNGLRFFRHAFESGRVMQERLGQTRNVFRLVRLFGNVMSGVFVIGIVLSLAGLLVPIPLMALDLLTGAIQAYIFAILAMVFIAGVVSEGRPIPLSSPRTLP